MFLFLHAPVAIALTEHISNPAAAFAIGAASHFLLDLIPHGDRQVVEWMSKKTSRARVRIFALMAAADTALVGLIIWKISFTTAIHGNLIAAALGSIAPDYLWGLHEVTKWRSLDAYRRFHTWFQSHHGRDVPFWFGLVYQAALAFSVVSFSVR